MRCRFAGLRGSWLLPAVLSMTAGAVDVIGFLALGGLFTAHISGNLWVVAAHHITGGFSRVGPLLSVPVFIAVLGVVTRVFGRGEKASAGSRRTFLVLHVAPLAACLGLGVSFGPFADAEHPVAVLVGMLAVAAMAGQLYVQAGPLQAMLRQQPVCLLRPLFHDRPIALRGRHS